MDILSFVKRLPGFRSGWAKVALGAVAITAAFSVGWLLRGHFIRTASTEATRALSVQVPGTDIVVGQGTPAQLMAMNLVPTSHQHEGDASGRSIGWRDDSGSTTLVSAMVYFDTNCGEGSSSVDGGIGNWGIGNGALDRPVTGTTPGCFEGANLRHAWFMNESHVQWIDGDHRFEDGRLIDGAREGCWSFWYHDELFDSGRSGTYEKDKKVESAPSPLGDFGYDDEK